MEEVKTRKRGIKKQLGAVAGVLGTNDQLIMDRSNIEEVKTYHQNLAVAF